MDLKVPISTGFSNAFDRYSFASSSAKPSFKSSLVTTISTSLSYVSVPFATLPNIANSSIT